MYKKKLSIPFCTQNIVKVSYAIAMYMRSQVSPSLVVSTRIMALARTMDPRSLPTAYHVPVSCQRNDTTLHSQAMYRMFILTSHSSHSVGAYPFQVDILENGKAADWTLQGGRCSRHVALLIN